MSSIMFAGGSRSFKGESGSRDLFTCCAGSRHVSLTEELDVSPLLESRRGASSSFFAPRDRIPTIRRLTECGHNVASSPEVLKGQHRPILPPLAAAFLGNNNDDVCLRQLQQTAVVSPTWNTRATSPHKRASIASIEAQSLSRHEILINEIIDTPPGVKRNFATANLHQKALNDRRPIECAVSPSRSRHRRASTSCSATASNQPPAVSPIHYVFDSGGPGGGAGRPTFFSMSPSPVAPAVTSPRPVVSSNASSLVSPYQTAGQRHRRQNTVQPKIRNHAIVPPAASFARDPSPLAATVPQPSGRRASVKLESREATRPNLPISAPPTIIYSPATPFEETTIGGDAPLPSLSLSVTKYPSFAEQITVSPPSSKGIDFGLTPLAHSGTASRSLAPKLSASSRNFITDDLVVNDANSSFDSPRVSPPGSPPGISPRNASPRTLAPPPPPAVNSVAFETQQKVDLYMINSNSGSSSPLLLSPKPTTSPRSVAFADSPGKLSHDRTRKSAAQRKAEEESRTAIGGSGGISKLARSQSRAAVLFNDQHPLLILLKSNPQLVDVASFYGEETASPSSNQRFFNEVKHFGSEIYPPSAITVTSIDPMNSPPRPSKKIKLKTDLMLGTIVICDASTQMPIDVFELSKIQLALNWKQLMLYQKLHRFMLSDAIKALSPQQRHALVVLEYVDVADYVRRLWVFFEKEADASSCVAYLRCAIALLPAM